MKLTIITINYNNAEGLRKTINSVLNQTSKDFEYIVVDGASKDNSNEIISQCANMPMRCKFNYISEPDSGIYNAMNKGIKMATGEYVHFLNSGDWLVHEDIVEDMLKALPIGCDIFVGNKVSVREDGKIRIEKNNPVVSCLTFYRSTIQHTSAYIRKSLFDEYGLYDETLKIVSDWKWYLIVAGLNKAEVAFIDINVSYFDTTGISSTNLGLDKAERRKVLEELIPAPILADYDNYNFDIDQMERIKKYPVLYRLFWVIERCLFKLEKWRMKYWAWKKLI
jgi:glycosyltransferase involved in cell wall biosynthesis